MDLDDTLNIGSGSSYIPSNRNPVAGALACMTDLVDCCGTELTTVRTERGNWYFPDGNRVGELVSDGSTRVATWFLVNRGPNEVVNGQQVNGSVRLLRRFSNIPQRGHFRCELPNVDNPSVNQILYINICEFCCY